MKDIYIINKAGEKEIFSEDKIYKSIRRVGASKKLATEIAAKIKQEVYPGMTTYEIFDRVEEMLEKEYPRGGIRFRLKEAIRNLGPSGFPFEKYVGAVLEQLGFIVELNQFIRGSCVVHEVDILAREKKYCLIGECKLHTLPGGKTDLKIGLHHYARYLDIEADGYCKKKFKNLKPRPIVITNNKFTTKLVQYAECVGLDLLGWRYPRSRGLEYIIESEKFYPITILPSFQGDLLEPFAEKKMMLAHDLLKIDPVEYAKKTGTSKEKIAALKREAETLLLEE